MRTTHLVSVAEYLRTVYRPDCDFVDGEVLERNLGEYDHATLQTQVLFYFASRAKEWNVKAVCEIRVQVREGRFRISDVCLLDADAPREQIIRTPPLLCVEVLSPEDTLKKMRVRVQDYLEMGVREVWILDPKTGWAWVCSGTETTPREGELALAGTPVKLDTAEVFRALDSSNASGARSTWT